GWAPGSRAFARTQAQLLQHRPQHGLVVEMLARQLAGRGGVAPVVGVDLLYRRHRGVGRVEGEEPLAGWQRPPEAGVLRHHRAPRGEIGGTAVAEPAGAQAHVLVLGHGELPPGGADVVAVAVDAARDLEAVADQPAVALQQLAVGRLAAAQRQLEALAAPRRQVEVPEKLVVLAPGVALTLVGDVAPLLAPVADRRVELGRLRRAVGPEIHHHRLAGRHEAEALL